MGSGTSPTSAEAGAAVRQAWGWPPRRRTRADIGRWPFRIGICSSLAVAVGVASLAEREALSPPEWGVIALVVIAVLPWLVDLLVVEVPPWLFVPVVLVPVAVLHDGTEFDPVPLLLAVLALDMGLWLGWRGSWPVVLASVAVVVWPFPDDTGEARWTTRLLGAMAAAWLVGLVLHGQLRRTERIRADRDRLRSAMTSARQALDAGDVAEATRVLEAADDQP